MSLRRTLIQLVGRNPFATRTGMGLWLPLMMEMLTVEMTYLPEVGITLCLNFRHYGDNESSGVMVLS